MITVRLESNRVTVIDLSGRITLGKDTSALRWLIKKLLERGDTRMVLNLADVSYMDSSGTGELVHAYRNARESGGRIKIANVSKKMQDMLQITKLYTVFEVYDDETDAVMAFARDAEREVSTAA